MPQVVLSFRYHLRAFQGVTGENITEGFTESDYRPFKTSVYCNQSGCQMVEQCLKPLSPRPFWRICVWTSLSSTSLTFHAYQYKNAFQEMLVQKCVLLSPFEQSSCPSLWRHTFRTALTVCQHLWSDDFTDLFTPSFPTFSHYSQYGRWQEAALRLTFLSFHPVSWIVVQDDQSTCVKIERSSNSAFLIHLCTSG